MKPCIKQKEKVRTKCLIFNHHNGGFLVDLKYTLSDMMELHHLEVDFENQ